MFDRMINNEEAESKSDRDMDAEIVNALWRVIGTWRDMSKMRQSVKMNFEEFSMAVSQRMYEENK